MPKFKRNFAREVDSGSWEEQFLVSTGASDLTKVQAVADEDGMIVKAVYKGSGAITLANYNGFPLGSVITDLQAFKTHIKVNATTWKSSAAYT